MKLTNNFKSCLRQFVYYYTNGSLPLVSNEPRLAEFDYREELKEEPGIVEGMFAVYSNVIHMDDQGRVTNQEHAIKRAAQYILLSLDADYHAEPVFEDWELKLP